MALPISSDTLVLVLGVVLAALYLFRDQIFNSSSKPKTPVVPVKETNGNGNPRDFVQKMKAGVCCCSFFTFQLHSYRYFFFVEKASCHLLRLTDWNR